MKKFDVYLYFTGFYPMEVEAENENDAVLKAREIMQKRFDTGNLDDANEIYAEINDTLERADDLDHADLL